LSSCCDQPEVKPRTGDLTIALAGNPNSGKTTIFNALTGMRQKVANYPGVTVEKKTGRFKLPTGQWVSVIDLPGTYSLVSRSPDETVAMEVLRGLRSDTPRPDAVIVVVDASNLQRNLYLVSQMIELGHPMVIALNMMDIAKRRGLNVSPERLSKQLGVPVIPIVGHKKQGVDELKSAIVHATIAPLPDWPVPEEMREQLLLVGGGLAILDSDPNAPAWPISGKKFGSVETDEKINVGSALADHDSQPVRQGGPYTEPDSAAFPRRALMVGEKDDGRHLDRYRAMAERLLIGDAASDVAPFAARPAIASMLNHATVRLSELGIDPMQADIEAHYEWIEQVASASLEPACLALLQPTSGFRVPGTGDNSETSRNPITLGYQSAIANLTDRADRVLLHKVWGLAIFVLVMAGLFVSIFWIAKPVMDGATNVVTFLGDWIGAKLLPEAGALHDLWADGIVAGVGGVVVFVPQIAILFFFLAVMEDTGYLARAAFLMDRLLSKVGLHGKSFIPMLSSFACAIPGIMATRTIENRKDRLATIFVAPFMSCSARLPVYTLLIGSFFAGYGALAQGGIMLSLYLLGIIAAVGTAWVFKRSLLKGAPTSFILELPAYKVPQWGQVLRTVWTNTKAFLTKAGTTIFCLSVILWAMTYYPRLPDAQVAAAQSAVRAELDRSYEYLAKGGSLVLEKSGKMAPFQVANTEAMSAGTRRDKSAFDTASEEFFKAQSDQSVAAERLRHSIAGRLGHAIEPVIKPLGFDWKMGVGLVGAFAAREVFVSTMGIVYAAGDTEESTTPLQDQMKADRYASGKPVWTPLVAVSLLVWFVLAMQCMSTLAIVRRETGGWAWPIGMLVYMNALAWVACFAVYQVGRIWFA